MIKIRFHQMFSMRDAARLQLDYEIQRDHISVYFEVDIDSVDYALDQIKSRRSELQYTFVSSDGGYYYIY